ncbi:PQQ-binding-like beta-propeller repeat protein [Carboxylicivirga mesophila]|uniref:PQQ-binding-like beta-propeller repeat protein n=1 Tax=Carboxylicivirga mesophila TaxID=1166478 RepID=A0ABS5K4U2_9BACT|nr:PQQ-binding-like beta-propeller repeat protein [Carboxylicivirga mesophila]MBS2210020.1 PQQ-binding-like beta-propeller repeat protein [Carboxylicivirga mesophila]
MNMNKWLITGILLCLVSLTYASYKGRVFIDDNGNGNYDRSEKGIKGVKVSDGLHVVCTDENGYFDLPGDDITRFIFITVPAGYQTSYKHYLPVDKQSQAYDFGLKPYIKTADNARFIQITDTETYEHHQWIDNIKEYAEQHEAGFIIHTGDICYEKGLQFHARTIHTQSMGVPVFYCIGNHDLVNGDYGEQLFESLFGPVYYSFDSGNTHFVVTPMLHGDHHPSYSKEQVYNWLVNDLKHVDPTMNLVVFNHDLLTFGDEFIYEGKKNQVLNLNNHNLKAWIYGHWHINFMKKHGDNGPVSVCASSPDKGGIDHSPSNFLVYDISDEGELNITPRYAYVDHQLVINSPINKVVKRTKSNDLLVSVNAYHSTAHASFIKGVITSDDGENVTFDLAPNTDWNWSATIPIRKKWKNKKLQLSVEATFADGEITSRKHTFELSNVVDANTSGHLMWLSNVKANTWMAKPIEADGKVFVAMIDDFRLKKCGIIALDVETGHNAWTYFTEGSIKNTICYEGGKVLATDHFGIAYALDAHNGQLLWKKELGQKGLGAYISGSVVKDGVYYTGFGNYLKALDIENGREVWSNTEWTGGEGDASTMTIAGNVLISGSNWRALFAHDIKTGKLLWKKSDNGFRFRSSSATWHNDALYVASQKGIGVMNAHTGELYRYFETPYDIQVATKPLLVDQLIVIGTSAEGIVALDRMTGKEVWKFKTGESLFYSAPYSKPESAAVESAPILITGMICFGASDGLLYAINPPDGKLIQSVELGAPVFSPVTPVENGFLVNDFGGSVYRFEIPDE